MDASAPSYPPSQRRRIPASADEWGVEFNQNPGGFDERNLVQLLGRPTLATCIYRARDCVTLVLERLSVIWPMLVPAAVLPFIVILVYVYAISKTRPADRSDTATVNADTQRQTTTEDNERQLQFVFLVITCCYCLIFFTIAVDYSKVSRMVRDNKKNNRLADNVSTWNSLPSQMANGQLSYNYLLGDLDLKEQRVSSFNAVNRSQMSTAPLNRNSGDTSLLQNCFSASNEEQTDSNWWETYALLRMNLHCIINMIHESAGRFVEGLVYAQTLAVRRLRNLAVTEQHYLLQSFLPDSVRILILGLLILIALASLTIIKLIRPFSKSFQSAWLVDCMFVTSAMTLFLLLHFVTLLLVACLASTAPSRIYVTGLLGRWFLTLMVCIILQCAIMPRMARLSGCLVTGQGRAIGFFSLFSKIQSDGNSLIVISTQDWKPIVVMIINSLIVAIVSSVLYQTNVLQMMLGSIGTLFKSLLNLSPVEGLALVLSVFGSHLNFIILFIPFLGKLSEPELFTIFLIMLVEMPPESDQFWVYQPSLDSNIKNSLTRDVLLTYTPQRAAIRSMLSFPLIILFSRIIYPVSGKFGTRASVFRRLRSMNCGRPFASIGESLLFFVAYSLRSVCRFLLMIAFVHCLEFIFQFIISAVRSSQTGESGLIFSNFQLRLFSMPMSLLMDTVEVLPANTQSLSYYIAYRFIYPKTTLQELFLELRLIKRNNTIDPFMRVLDSITSPAKEVVMCGSFTWHTLAMYIAFTFDCLHEARTNKTGFILRSCLAALLVYSAIYNLLYLACDPRMLQHFDNISRRWIQALKRYARNPVVNKRCTV